eukprot:762853-Hanusia_phi.AAC.1
MSLTGWTKGIFKRRPGPAAAMIVTASRAAAPGTPGHKGSHPIRVAHRPITQAERLVPAIPGKARPAGLLSNPALNNPGPAPGHGLSVRSFGSGYGTVVTRLVGGGGAKVK